MDIVTRRASAEDLKEMLEVESAAISIHYLNEVHKDFFADDKGEMTVAVNEEGRIMGFGKLTFMYDGSAWAETLRVHPKYQNLGAGNAIWKRFMEQCVKTHAQYIRMYTGKNNDISRHIAEKYGLDKIYEFSECSCENFEYESKANDFMQTVEYNAKFSCESITKSWGNYACFNRTFYSLDEPFIRGICKEGKVYEDGENVAAIGSRFMPERGIHIGFIKGDIEKCMSFAKNTAIGRNSPKITIMHRSDDNDMKETLQTLGFKYTLENLLMLEGKLF